jgi:hypothetical protein
MMGVKPIQAVHQHQVSSYLKNLNIQSNAALEIDSLRYQALINHKLSDTCKYDSKDWYIQNHLQPTQAMYFNMHTKSAVAAYFNCIAESRNLTNLTYNKFKELEFFPPLTYSDPRWIDSLFRVEEILNTINDMQTGQPYKTDHFRTKYLVLIFYSLAIQKQSTNLIREAQYHIQNCIKDSSTLIYVNIDNYLYSQSR